jgi:hypothetical protein
LFVTTYSFANNTEKSYDDDDSDRCREIAYRHANASGYEYASEEW